jgi:hypothetical protein
VAGSIMFGCGGVVLDVIENGFQVTMWARDIVRILLKSALGVFEGVRGSGGVRMWQIQSCLAV